MLTTRQLILRLHLKVLLILSVSLQTVVTSANTALVDNKVWGGRLANAGDKLTYSVRVAGVPAGEYIVAKPPIPDSVNCLTICAVIAPVVLSAKLVPVKTALVFLNAVGVALPIIYTPH